MRMGDSSAGGGLAIETEEVYGGQGSPAGLTVVCNDRGENAAAHVEFCRETQITRFQGCNQVIDNPVCHRFVESVLVAERPDIELEAFKFDTLLVRNIIQNQGREIGLSGFGTQTGKLGNLHMDMVVPFLSRIGEGFQVFAGVAGHSLISVKIG